MLVNLRLDSGPMTSKVPHRQRDLRRLQDEAPDSSSSDGSFIHNRRQHDLPQMHSQRYKAVLRQNHELLMSDVRLDRSMVLDELVERRGLTESDAETIRREDNPKDQVRELLFVLPDRGPSAFDIFVKSLKPDYPSIAKKLEDDQKSCSINVEDNACTVCKIKADVKLKDVIDRLYTNEILSSSDSRTILKCSQEIGWTQLQGKMKKNPVKSKAVLVDALNAKYPDLSCEYATVQTKHFTCFCRRLCTPKQQALPHPPTIGSSQSSSRSSSSSISSSPHQSFRTSFAFHRMSNIDEDMQTGCMPEDIMEDELRNGQLSHSEKDQAIKIPQIVVKCNSLPNTIKMTTTNKIQSGIDERVYEDNTGIYDNNIPFQKPEDTGQQDISKENTNDRLKFNRVAVRRKEFEFKE